VKLKPILFSPLNKSFLRAALCLLLGFLVFGGRAFATVEGWEIIGGPARVAINYSSNHGYYPRNRPYAFRYQCAALEAVRRDLVLQGKLENEPILIRIPDAHFTSNPRRTRLSLETIGLQRGDTEEILPARRYVIEWNGAARPEPTTRAFYDDLLLLTLGLQKLNAKNRSLTIFDWSNLRREYSRQAASYRNIVQHFDPVWSPDNRFLVFTHWQNGHADFYVLDVARRVVWKLPSLRSAPSGRPVWSDDGKFLAYADLQTVVIFQTENHQSQTLDSPFNNRYEPQEVMLNFHSQQKLKTILRISGAINAFSDYVTLEYDVRAKRTLPQSVQNKRPLWAKDSLMEERALESKRVKSPNKVWTAVIEESRGKRRLILRDGQSAERFRVADLPIKTAPALAVIESVPQQRSRVPLIMWLALGAGLVSGAYFSARIFLRVRN
jgi:hypothetical protein